MDLRIANSIENLNIRDLSVIHDEKGSVLHMIRSDSKNFSRFGEIYFSEIEFDVIKGWKRHKISTQNFAVPSGSIKLVVYDNREGSASKGEVLEMVLGRENYKLVTIPPKLWYSFKGLSTKTSIIANCIDYPHEPSESDTLAIHNNQIPYHWQ